MARTFDAGAGVERENRLDGHFSRVDHLDALEDAVVAQLEVGGPQTADGLTTVGDEHVDPHRERA
jgi:hypothetical protein